ncbi:MAG: hypothetical protein E6J58_04995 [Deltaproteobacteria bacterium]|nr:MAG: hypothetical protein E6J67_00135 [Deltaproteobacteria bacterium]TMB41057.1 MAG: hypothetical protein E6J58_04995 [Deltaproteobacteria bacterium]
MRKLSVLILSLLLFPAIASAQSEGPPPPPDSQDVKMAQPPDAEPGMQPPAPPAAPPSPASDSDQVGILQQPAPASPPATAAPQQTGQWVYTNQYGWVWMPYGQQYVDEGTYGASSPYQYVYCVGVGWSWVAAPWLWGWGAYPYFGAWGPSHFGWYRGLYRAGYGWGRYRGGSRSYAGGYRSTRPVGGGYVSGRTSRSFGAPTRGRSFPARTRIAASGSHRR